jgi:hypothetical protein
MPPLLMPGPGLGPLGYARGGARVPQSRYSLSFTAASSQYVRVPYAAALDPTGDLTLSVWLKAAGSIDSTQGTGIVALWNISGRKSYFLWSQSGNVMFGAASSAGTTWAGGASGGAGSVNDGVWHHLAVTRSGNTATVYLDGAQVAQATTANNAPSGSGTGNDLMFGTWGAPFNNNYLNARLDDVVLVPSALTPTQIAALAAGTLDPATLTTAGLWRLEEGTGTTTADSSGNGNTGTLTNGPTWSTDVPTQLQ